MRKAFRMTNRELSDMPSAASHGGTKPERRRHGSQVVEQCPALILAQNCQSLSCDRARDRKRCEAAASQHHVTTGPSDLGPSGYCDRDIRTSEHRRVVDSIADDDDACALGVQAVQPAQLVRGQLARVPVGDVQLGRNARTWPARRRSRSSIPARSA